MPHEIAYTANGEAMMMFYGDKPWFIADTSLRTVMSSSRSPNIRHRCSS